MSALRVVPALKACSRPSVLRMTLRCNSANTNPDQPESKTAESKTSAEPKPKKTVAELDESLRQKMQDLAGDGGEAGLELEDGQPVSMKRSVRNNMFRYI